MNLLGIALMVKDEAKRVLRTLETVRPILEKLFVQDTGSSDDTIEVITRWAAENGVDLTMTEEAFIDFSTNRNKLLETCAGKAEYVLMLDANDEVHHCESLKAFVEANRDCGVFNLNFRWREASGQKFNYSRIAVMRPDPERIFYTGRVHEHVTSNTGDIILANIPEAFISQDRRLDKTSLPRTEWDIEMLKLDLEDKPRDSRTLFYLGQALGNIGRHEEAAEYYRKVVAMEPEPPDYYRSVMNLVQCCFALEQMREARELLLECYRRHKRAEPVFYVAAAFHAEGDYESAMPYCIDACSYEVAEMAPVFGDVFMSNIYERDRWNLLADLGQRVGRPDMVRRAVEKLGRAPDPVTTPLDQLE